MTQSFEHTFEPPPPPRGARTQWVAWAVIALAIVTHVTVARSTRTASRAERSASSLNLRLGARYAVGLKVLFGHAYMRPTIDELTAQLSRQATTMTLGLRVIPALAELQGSEEAVKYLESIDVSNADDADREDARALRAIYDGKPDAGDALDAARARLVERHGWFGRLAATWHLPSDDPQRRAALAPARRTVIAAFAGFATLLLLLLIGLGLLVTGIVLASQRGVRPHPSLRTPLPAGLLVEAFALYLVGYVAMGLLNRAAGGTGLSTAWRIAAALAPLACLWPLLRGMHPAELRESLGWHRGRGFWREAGAGVVGYLAGLPIVCIGLIVALLLSRVSGREASHPVVEMISTRFWEIVTLLALAAVYAPLAEETLFRGALYRGARPVFGAVLAALAVSLVFAMMHPQGWVAIPSLMSIALVLTALREWRGSIIAPVVAHAINNAALVVFLVLIAG